ncbi:MAG: hypothetical protein P4L93_09520 [Coriobacteriia bacterium]|nr:hypothetical protein [Coriobacteriia bacterium]
MVAWIEAYGQIIAFFIQLLFYITVAVSAAWAAITFARYVKYMTSDEIVVESADEVSVDEFVE